MPKSPPLPGIEDKVAFLSKARAYPGYRGEIEVVETHMSWVFITRNLVYKLKKPRARKLIDFTNLEARYHNCKEEVRLNRRLGDDIYLGIERLSLHPGGQLRLGGDGVTVDWLVVMRRIPKAAFLDDQIKTGQVDYEAVRCATELLAAFYRRTGAVDMTPEQYRERLDRTVRSTLKSLDDYQMPRARLQWLAGHQLSLLERNPQMFEERARSGMIVEAHGDLRPEHVCLTNPPVVIDCLEFNRDLRIRDCVDELAFLAMECERLNNFRVGEIVLGRYATITGDRPAAALIAFYKCLQACVRAQLYVWHLEDDPEQTRGSWLDRAHSYLSMAEGYTEHFDI